ncbi:hypothetical protein BJ742DRAFT_767953 [Cladochytrium replicatum]|nr:hypothetical protein BJ742DRAFT_767953 [Cladochytrium replicatum]
MDSVFSKPVEKVWSTIRPGLFDWWKSAVVKSTVEGDSASAVGSLRKITFKDGTVQTFRILQLSDLERSRTITWEVIESSPALTYHAAVHTIKVYKVTTDNTTFVEWSSDFSTGADTAAVVEDSRFKKREAFNDLATYLK